jgi:hypothetical protein
MLNGDNNIVYRNCVDKEKGDCPYMNRNEYGTAGCNIDGIIQVEYYGCVPQVVIKKTIERCKGD